MSTKYSNATDTEDGMNEYTEWKGWDEADGTASERYNELFIRLSNRWERVIRILIIVFLVLLILSQAMLHWPLFRKSVVKVEQLEGEPYEQTFNSRAGR